MSQINNLTQQVANLTSDKNTLNQQVTDLNSELESLRAQNTLLAITIPIVMGAITAASVAIAAYTVHDKRKAVKNALGTRETQATKS